MVRPERTRAWQRVAVPPTSVLPMLAAVVLERVRPWPRSVLAGHRRTGALLVLAGTGTNLWATTARPGDIDHPERLVTSGPYAVSGHPMYVGWHLAQLGTVLAGRSAWPAVGLAVAVVLTHRVVLREEDGLARQFGTDYRRYSRRVGRYL